MSNDSSGILCDDKKLLFNFTWPIIYIFISCIMCTVADLVGSRLPKSYIPFSNTLSKQKDLQTKLKWYISDSERVSGAIFRRYRLLYSDRNDT